MHWEYRAGYRSEQISYISNRSIGCSSMLPAGAPMLGVPIHGRGVFQHSNIISILRECMCRRMSDGGGMLYLFSSFSVVGDGAAVDFVPDILK